MKDEQVTQLSILGVVSIVGLIAAIGLLSTPTTTHAPSMGISSGGQDTVVGQQALFGRFLGSNEETPTESPPSDSSPSTTNRFEDRSLTDRSPLQILGNNVEEIIQETEQVIQEIPRSQEIHTYGLTKEPTANDLNLVSGISGDSACLEATNLYNEMTSLEARLGATKEDVRALELTTTILERSMAQGDCWLQLYQNQLENDEFVEPQSQDNLSTDEEQTVAAKTVIRAFKDGEDPTEALQNTLGETDNIGSLIEIVNIHQNSKQTNEYIAQELQSIDLLSDIQRTVRSDEASQILGLSEDSSSALAGPTPQRLGVRSNWEVWNDDEMKQRYIQSYEDAYEQTGLSGFLSIFSTDGPAWRTDVASLEEMKENYPRSPSLTERQAELLVELTKRGFDPGRVLERKWSLSSGRTASVRADGLLDKDNQTIWLRSPEGVERGKRTAGGFAALGSSGQVLGHELVHFFHYNLGPEETKQALDEAWQRSPGANEYADREDFPHTIDFGQRGCLADRECYRNLPQERLAFGLQNQMNAEVIRDQTHRERQRVTSRTQLNQRMVVALVDAYLEKKPGYSEAIQAQIVQEIQDQVSSNAEEQLEDTTADGSTSTTEDSSQDSAFGFNSDSGGFLS